VARVQSTLIRILENFKLAEEAILTGIGCLREAI